MDLFLSKKINGHKIISTPPASPIKLMRCAGMAALVLCFLMPNAYAALPGKNNFVVSESAAIPISGTIKDSNGQTVIGVTVRVKGTQIAVSTNADGKYTINVPDRDATLVFTFIGYETKEVQVGDSNTLDVLLKESASNLNEVVVIGFGTEKKASVVGSISTIKGQDIVKSPTPNLTNGLAGRVPGLTAVQTTGKPGFDAATILVRGQSTFNNAGAAIIVDGVERPGFGDIDPEQVESITVLKDAAATAVYGIRGSGGVIVVTTKRGKQGKTIVSYTGNYGLQALTGIPATLDAYNSARLKNEALANDGSAPMFNDVEIQKFKDHSDPIWYPDVNWYKTVVKSYSPQTSHSVNVSGGGKVASYFVNVGYLYQDGMTKDFGSPKGFRSVNNLSKYNFRTNIDLNLTSDIKVGVTLGGVSKKAYSPGNTSFGDIGFVISKLINIPSYAMPIEIPGVGYTAAPGVGLNLLSPIALLTNDGFQINEDNNIESLFSLDYNLGKLVKGLSFHGSLAFDSYSTTITTASTGFRTYDILDRKNKIYGISPQHQTEVYSTTLSTNPSPTPPAGSFGNNVNTNIQLKLAYERSFGNHNVNVNVVGVRQARSLIGADAVRAMQNLVGRVSYNYKGKYLIEPSVSYSGSENFAPGKRYGLFPAIGVGYNISEEEFLKKVSWIDNIKIRGSYGLTGNDQIGGTRFLYLDDYSISATTQAFGDPNSITNYNAITHSKIGNPNVTWEKLTKRDIGIDASFGRGLLTLTLGLFDVRNKDILVTNPLSRLTQYGEAFPAINVGEVYNKGYEIELGHSNHFGEISYGIRATFSYAKNKIINIDEAPGTPDYQKLAGKRIGQFIGYLTDGFYQSAADIANSPVNTLGKVIPGDLKFKDYNNDGKITPDDRVPIGYSNRPDVNYSITPSVSWRGLSLEVMFQGADQVSSNVQFTEKNDGQQMYEFMLNRWTPATAATADWPALHSLSSNFVSYLPNDYLLQNAAYLKIRNAQLSWMLPSTWTKKLGINRLQVYVSGQNLYTWTKYRFGLDPELGSNGSYPTSKVYNLGVRVNF